MNRKIRKDHKLIIKIKKINSEIDEVCEELTKELGFKVNWQDALELLKKPPSRLKKDIGNISDETYESFKYF